MRKAFFYASHALAVLVFYSFYMFMLWACIEMGNKIADYGSTFWTGLTEAGFAVLMLAAVALFVAAAYRLLVQGPDTAPLGEASPVSARRPQGARRSPAPTA